MRKAFFRERFSDNPGAFVAIVAWDTVPCKHQKAEYEIIDINDDQFDLIVEALADGKEIKYNFGTQGIEVK